VAEKGDHKEGRLRARPVGAYRTAPVGPPPPVPERGDFLLGVPTTYRPGSPAPLTVMLHGAASRAEDVSVLLEGLAERLGVILLAPNSRGYTWDVLLGRYGPDVAAIDRVLAWTFSSYAIDPARVAIGGFSDGASYALSLGLTNGDLFSHVLAFSPGFAAPARRVCSPRVFVSHGTRDAVLPIDRCSRRIVPALQRAGYDVAYREFDGGHAVPPEIVHDAANWFATDGD
jgi:phospholipase/carboxylesterase